MIKLDILQLTNQMEIKITLFGEAGKRNPTLKLIGVGKTTFLYQYLTNEFHEYIDPTIEEEFRKKIIFQDETIDLTIVDTFDFGFFSFIKKRVPSHERCLHQTFKWISLVL
jgi:GTPase SAR1 family protein